MLGKRSRHSETTAALGGVEKIPICQRQRNGKPRFEPKELVFSGGVCNPEVPLCATAQQGTPASPPLGRVDKDLRFGMALCPVHLQGCLRPRKGFAECHSVLLERAPLQGKGVHHFPLYTALPLE